jgi:post-segregation antitoxin (ccd killing protein)
MRTKLTVTIDRDLIPKARQRARAEGLSLSRLIERALAALTSGAEPSFSQRWRGRLAPANRRDARYRALAKKYL